ncbi:UV damage repair endonuclease [Vibrio phage S4-7]|nr:UV damage repair endonuclease [Vibrio phage S4-7]
MQNFNGKLGTVCMTGDFDRSTGKFKAYKDTTIGTVTRKSLLQICKLDNVDDLTPNHAVQHHKQLKAKLQPKVKQNINALYNQLRYVSQMPVGCQLFRISSNLLPMFDHPTFNAIYDTELLQLVDTLLARCKRLIDKHSIRVCCHPDQYNVINSDSIKTRTQTFNCLYMHKYFMERLTTADQTSINIHLNGKLDHIPEFDHGLHSDLIPWLSFENEDKVGTAFVADTHNTLAVCEKYSIKMLFDIHHHHVMTGDHISVNDSLIDRIIATWGGVHPLMHLSQGREHSTDKKHSDFITDDFLIEHVFNYLHFADVELEAKGKTTAVCDLHHKIQQIENNY